MPGDPIGLQALWHDVMPHSAPALTAVKLHVFDKKKFKTLVVKQPDQRWGILEYTAACQVRYEEKLSDLGGASGGGVQDLVTKWSASRSASWTISNVGLACPTVGNTLLPPM